MDEILFTNSLVLNVIEPPIHTFHHAISLLKYSTEEQDSSFLKKSFKIDLNVYCQISESIVTFVGRGAIFIQPRQEVQEFEISLTRPVGSTMFSRLLYKLKSHYLGFTREEMQEEIDRLDSSCNPKVFNETSQGVIKLRAQYITNDLLHREMINHESVRQVTMKEDPEVVLQRIKRNARFRALDDDYVNRQSDQIKFNPKTQEIIDRIVERRKKEASFE